MNSILVNLAIIASMLVVACHANDLSDCEILSQNLAHYMKEKQMDKGVAFIENNCPSKVLLTHILWVKVANSPKPDSLVERSPGKQYRLANEKKKEQTQWLKTAESKVSNYYATLADIATKAKRAPSGKVFEYPSSSAIDDLLEEVDADNFESIDRMGMDYFWTHSDDENIMKFLKVAGSLKDH